MALKDYKDYTLLLDPDRWELVLDNNGLIQTTTGAYAIAQNVANAVKLFANDAYFHREDGIPHYEIELGHKPPYALLRTWIINAAMGVDGVADARVEWMEFTAEKVLTGNIILTLTDGGEINVSF